MECNEYFILSQASTRGSWLIKNYQEKSYFFLENLGDK